MNGGYSIISLNDSTFVIDGDPVNIENIYNDVENAYKNNKPICIGKYFSDIYEYGCGFVTVERTKIADTYSYVLYNHVHSFKIYNNNDVEIYSL